MDLGDASDEERPTKVFHGMQGASVHHLSPLNPVMNHHVYIPLRQDISTPWPSPSPQSEKMMANLKIKQVNALLELSWTMSLAVVLTKQVHHEAI